MAAVHEDASPPEPVEPTPFLRVMKGDPTPQEMAALVTVLAGSLGHPGTGARAPAHREPEWNAPRRLHRVVHPHGLGGWRSSSLPH